MNKKIKTLLIIISFNIYSMDINEKLFDAIYNYNIDEAIVLIKDGANINAKDWFNRTPLHVAVNTGFAEISELLASEININSQDRDGETPLFEACRKGYFNIVNLLIKLKADIKIQNKDNQTLLHIACLNGNKDIILLLLQNNMDANAKDNFGYTPIYYAINKKIAKLLISKGANINNKSEYRGNTVLHCAIIKGNKDIVELLLELGADTTIKNDQGFVAADIAENNLQAKELINNYMPIAKR